MALPIWLLADLRARLEALSQRSVAEELGVLAASLEHDIRSPLAVLWKELDTLRHRYQHDSALMARLQRLNQCAERISAATQVIPISREITSNFLDLASPVNVVAVLRAAADAVKRTDRVGDVMVMIENDKNEIMVRGDGARLTQAFVNIINNGIEASRAKQNVRPRVAIRCSSAKSSDAVTIVVHDDGTGVPEHVLTRLTKPFFTTKTGAGRNRGIGLFVTARVIRIHSGTMSFDTDGHSYTNVTVTLPILMSKHLETAA